MVVRAARAEQAEPLRQVEAAIVVRFAMVRVQALDAGQTRLHKLRNKLIAFRLAGMRQDCTSPVAHDGLHRIAGIHVRDIA